MSEQELNEIIAQNITELLEKHGKTQFDLADYMNVTQATVSNWCSGIKMPRMDKIDRICEYFAIKRSQLMERSCNEEEYYINPETAAMAQEISDNPDLHMLFSALRDSSPEDLKLVADMVKRFKGVD